MSAPRLTLQKNFGPALRDARQKAGKTQEKLAEDSGVHVTFISELENGHKSPSLDTLEKRALALGRAPHQLIRMAEDHAVP
ncbi:MAG: helix-turn-helix domain-containing protein [Actinomycetota bacterium]